MSVFKITVAASALACLAAPAFAQSLGGVFGPAVNEGHASAQYRAGYAPDSERFGQRLHYQKSINGDVMLRGVIQARETSDSDFDFDYIGAEAFWQISDDGAPWQTGLRFDLRIRDDDRPHSVGLNWMNEWALSPRLRGRAVVLTSADAGDNARDGVFVQTRGQLNYALESGRGVGLELFSAYGSTDDFRDFEDQSHEIGPYITAPITSEWSIFAGLLVGLTDGAPDSNLKLWITRGF